MVTSFERRWDAERDLHLIPSQDILAHVESADCPCLPQAEYVPAEGIYGGAWLYTHYAWDGRSGLDA